MGSRDQRTPGDQIRSHYVLACFQCASIKWDNTIAYFTQKPFSSSMLLVAAKTMQGAPLPASKTHCVPEYHHQLLQLSHMQHQVCTEFSSTHTNTGFYSHLSVIPYSPITVAPSKDRATSGSACTSAQHINARNRWSNSPVVSNT